MLPFSAIHLGKYGVNWHARVSEHFEKRERVAGTRNGGDAVQDFPMGRKEGVAVVLGYFPEGRWQGVTRGFSRVILVDEFRIHSTGGDGMVETDRMILRGILARQVSERREVEFLGAHTVENVAKIPDGSLNLLYLPGEASPAWLCSVLPHWLPKLREGGMICGDAYGLPHWPDATYSLAILLGSPDELAGDGRWRKQYRADARPLRGVRGGNPGEDDGIVVLSGGVGSAESLLLSIHSVRRHWNRPVQVWHQGLEDESLRMVCTRLGDRVLCGLLQNSCNGGIHKRSVSGSGFPANSRFETGACLDWASAIRSRLRPGCWIRNRSFARFEEWELDERGAGSLYDRGRIRRGKG